MQLYLTDEKRAWQDDLNGETSVYLIKDESGKIACYFSIRCGMIVGKDPGENLSDEEKNIVESYVSAKNEQNKAAIQNLYDAINIIFPDKADYLLSIASRQLERKIEASSIGQSQNTINVPVCYSGIEFKHLCRNANYMKNKNIQAPLGFGLFWEKIVPIIIEISEKIGCKYIYLYAADKFLHNNGRNAKRLVQYYKNDLKFYECNETMKFVKPDYDKFCYGLLQKISDLQRNREIIWERFSDVCE